MTVRQLLDSVKQKPHPPIQLQYLAFRQVNLRLRCENRHHGSQLRLLGLDGELYLKGLRLYIEQVIKDIEGSAFHSRCNIREAKRDAPIEVLLNCELLEILLIWVIHGDVHAFDIVIGALIIGIELGSLYNEYCLEHGLGR